MHARCRQLRPWGGWGGAPGQVPEVGRGRAPPGSAAGGALAARAQAGSGPRCRGHGVWEPEQVTGALTRTSPQEPPWSSSGQAALARGGEVCARRKCAPESAALILAPFWGWGRGLEPKAWQGPRQQDSQVTPVFPLHEDQGPQTHTALRPAHGRAPVHSRLPARSQPHWLRSCLGAGAAEGGRGEVRAHQPSPKDQTLRLGFSNSESRNCVPFPGEETRPRGRPGAPSLGQGVGRRAVTEGQVPGGASPHGRGASCVSVRPRGRGGGWSSAAPCRLLHPRGTSACQEGCPAGGAWLQGAQVPGCHLSAQAPVSAAAAAHRSLHPPGAQTLPSPRCPARASPRGSSDFPCTTWTSRGSTSSWARCSSP